MNIAFDRKGLTNLLIVKEARLWRGHSMVSDLQYQAIASLYPSPLFHPNIFIRILLFLATLIALGGVTGTLFLMLGLENDRSVSLSCIIYGAASAIMLEQMIIRKMQHFRSGVVEALLYHSAGFFVGGIAGLFDFNEHVVLPAVFLVSLFAAIRYIDWIASFVSFGSFAAWVFLLLYEAGGFMQQLIPMAFILIFFPLYVLVQALRKQDLYYWWRECLVIIESLSLVVVCAAGNYFVVRELSVELMGLDVPQGADIPLAPVFYSLTVLIPIAYLYFGIRRKDIVLIRISLLGLAFCVFTFKYYFSLGHPEITLTIAGFFLIIIAMMVYRFLRQPRSGFTREKLLTEKWAEANPEAVLISQTLGGNKIPTETSVQGGGGEFGGGGASGSY